MQHRDAPTCLRPGSVILTGLTWGMPPGPGWSRGSSPAGTLGPAFLCADACCAEMAIPSCPGTLRPISVVTREAPQEQLGTHGAGVSKGPGSPQSRGLGNALWALSQGQLALPTFQTE